MYEYVPGGDLGDVIRTLQPRSPEDRCQQAIDDLRQLASAVAHFHKLTPPVVHRDLKPNNILLDSANKRLRITDFGIGAVAARAALGEEARGGGTSVGRLMSYMCGSHTPLYASPQQRTGSDPDPRDDVHALGVIAFQLLTGDLVAAPGRAMDDDLRDIGAPEGLVALIGRSVAQKADRRPRDAREWETALAALVQDVTRDRVPETGQQQPEAAFARFLAASTAPQKPKVRKRSSGQHHCYARTPSEIRTPDFRLVRRQST